MLLSLKRKADAYVQVLASALLPEVYQSQRYVFISVWTGEVHYYSKTKRVIVTFDLISNDLLCRCSGSGSSHRPCLHKAVAKWYLRQTMPLVFSSSDGTVTDSFTIVNDLKNATCNKMTNYLLNSELFSVNEKHSYEVEVHTSEIIIIVKGV